MTELRGGEEKPHTGWEHICGSATSVAQPLDVAFMKAFKCAMARTAGEHFARCVLQQEPGAPVQVEMGVKILRPVFVVGVADAIKQIEKDIHFSKGWGSIMPAGSRAVLAAAHEPNARATCSNNSRAASGWRDRGR